MKRTAGSFVRIQAVPKVYHSIVQVDYFTDVHWETNLKNLNSFFLDGQHNSLQSTEESTVGDQTVVALSQVDVSGGNKCPRI